MGAQPSRPSRHRERDYHSDSEDEEDEYWRSQGYERIHYDRNQQPYLRAPRPRHEDHRSHPHSRSDPYGPPRHQGQGPRVFYDSIPDYWATRQASRGESPYQEPRARAPQQGYYEDPRARAPRQEYFEDPRARAPQPGYYEDPRARAPHQAYHEDPRVILAQRVAQTQAYCAQQDPRTQQQDPRQYQNYQRADPHTQDPYAHLRAAYAQRAAQAQAQADPYAHLRAAYAQRAGPGQASAHLPPDRQSSPLHHSTMDPSLTAQDIEALNIHNYARGLKGIQPLQWDAKLANDAAEYARHLSSIRSMVHSGCDDGENLMMSSDPASTYAVAVRGWLAEEKDYRGQAIGDGDFSAYGHYTQCMWKDTTLIGMGSARSADGIVFVVARYSAAGNMMGEKPY